jgi:hypothetical protein
MNAPLNRPGYGEPPTLDAIPRGHFAETRSGAWHVVDSKVRRGQQRIDDSLQSFVSGLGTWKDPTVQLKFYLKLLNRDEVENAFRGDWIARKIVMAPAEDATREWRAWQASQEQIEAIEEEERTHNIQKKTREAIFKARLYGGAGMVIGVDDGKDVIEPLDLDRVKRGDLKFVVVMNRYELAAGPRIYNVNSPWYTYPEYFTVQTPMFGFYNEGGDTYPNSYASGEWTPPTTKPGEADRTGRGDPARQVTPSTGMVRIHPSRVVQFVGNELPDWRLVPLGGLWGDSVLQTIDDILKDFGLTIGSVANMVNDAKMDVIKIPNLTSVHLATADATSKLLARFGMANQAKSTVNSLLLDTGEEWERIQSTFAGLPDVMKQFMMLICAGGDLPYSRVFGQGGSRGIGEQGSNASGGPQDLKGYYDFIASRQKTVYTPAMDPLDQVLLRSALGRYDPNVFYEWSPLYQPDPKEVAAIGFQKAQTTQIYVNMGLINEDAMRSAVVNQLIEDGDYPGLEDAIEEFGEAPEEPEGDFDPQSGAVIPGTPTHAAMKAIAPPSGGTSEAQDAAAPQRRRYLLGKRSFRQFRQAHVEDSYFSDLQWRAAAAAKGGVIVPGSHGKFFVGIEDSYFAHLNDVWGPAAWEASAAARAAEKGSGSGGGFANFAERDAFVAKLNNRLNAIKEGQADVIGSTTVLKNRGGLFNVEGKKTRMESGHVVAHLMKLHAKGGVHTITDELIVDYWSQAARDAAAEARAARAKATAAFQYADESRDAGDEKSEVRYRTVSNFHSTAAAAWESAHKAHLSGDKTTAREQEENARTNAGAAERLKRKHGLRDAVINDLKPRTLYVRRDVLNADAIVKWAKKAGFKTTLPADDMHVTLAFSKSPVDWMKAGDNWGGEQDGKLKVRPGGVRVLEKFGDGAGCIVLAFSCSELTWRHEQIKRDAGASWDYPDYNPHITITYDVGDLDWQKVEPYRGPIVLGPEIFEEIDEDWKSGIVAEDAVDDAPTLEELASNAVYDVIAASIEKNDFAAEVMQAETMIYELIEKLAKDHGVTQGAVHEMLSTLDVVKNDKVVAEAVARWRPPSNVLRT